MTTNFYVSPQGDDSRRGSCQNPWKTISKAASVAKAGDIVHVLTGLYAETVNIRNSGKPKAPITFRADGKVTIRPEKNPQLNFPQIDDGFRLVGKHHILIEGFQITDYREGIFLYDAHHITLRNLRIYEGTLGIRVDGSHCHHLLLEDIEISKNENSGLEAWRETGLTHSLIKNLSSHHNKCKGGKDGIALDHQGIRDDILFVNCQAYNNGMDGFDISGRIIGKGVTLDGCLAYNNALDPKGWGAGFKVRSNCHLYNCLVYNNRQHEGGITTGGENITIYNCLLSNNRPAGISIFARNVPVRNCIFYKEKRPIVCKQPVKLDYNLYYQSSLANLTRIGPHSLRGVNPQFVNPDKFDFHLRKGSPAIGRGTREGAPRHDLEGVTRSLDEGVTIGPYEYQAKS